MLYFYGLLSLELFIEDGGVWEGWLVFTTLLVCSLYEAKAYPYLADTNPHLEVSARSNGTPHWIRR